MIKKTRVVSEFSGCSLPPCYGCRGPQPCETSPLRNITVDLRSDLTMWTASDFLYVAHLGGPVKKKKNKNCQEVASPALGIFLATSFIYCLWRLGLLLCWRVVINMQLTHTWFHGLGRGYVTITSSQVSILCERFPCGSAGKESTCNAGDLGLIPGLGRSPGEGKGYPTHFQYSGLENAMDCIVHGVAKSWTRLFQVSDFHFTSFCEQDQALLCRVPKIDQQIYFLESIESWCSCATAHV